MKTRLNPPRSGLLHLVVYLGMTTLFWAGAQTGAESVEEATKTRTPKIRSPSELGSYYEVEVPDTLDLAERARLGVNHFTMSISEEDDYEMYWGVQPLGLPQDMMQMIGHAGERKLGCAFGECNPPYMVMWWSPLQACQPKAWEALAMLRLMSGSQQLLEREARMVETLASYLGPDGLYWVPASPKKTWLGPPEIHPLANVHGQGRMMRAMVAWHQYTGDPAWKERIDRMVAGLDKIVVHKKNYAYVPVYGHIPQEYFRSCYTQQGWKDTVEPNHEKFGEEGSMFNHQGHLPGVLAHWHKLTGNEQALRLAGELVRFLTQPSFWADWKGGEYPGVAGAEHAHWQGHFHGHINVLRAILEYAIAVNDARLKAFVRDGYEWARQTGLARIGLVGDGQGCGCGRLIGLAVKLTYAGVGDYWEDVDLYIRNHGVEMQFTSDDIPFLKKLGAGKPAPPYHSGMSTNAVIETTLGGFSNHVPPYKTSTSLCCSPHGNMGLFYAWDGALQCEDAVVRVNLLLNRASPWMDVDSYLPYEGKVVLKNKTAREAFVRAPLWVDLQAVQCQVGKKDITNTWFGRYLRIQPLNPGDTVTIQFPVAEWVEKWTVSNLGWPGSEKTVHTCRFRANTLVEMTPPLMPGSPLYQQRPDKFKAQVAPRKKVTRFVTPLVLKW